jgi:hypothetical protein
VNLRFLALFATGYLMAYAVDRWRKSGLYGEQELYALENSQMTFSDPSRPSIDYMRQRVLEQEAGLGDTLIHLG